MTEYSRRRFLEQTALAGVGLLMSSLNGFTGQVTAKKIRVAVIGCGSVSGRYLPSLAKCPFAEVVSVCDIIKERAINRAKEFTIPNVYASIDELLAGVPFDLMVPLTDMQAHGRLNKMALLAGPTWSSFFYEKGGSSLPDLGVYNIATLTGLLGPAQSVMVMTTIVNPERKIDQKGTIKVEAEDNAMLILEHQKGILSPKISGANRFGEVVSDGS